MGVVVAIIYDDAKPNKKNNSSFFNVCVRGYFFLGFFLAFFFISKRI